MSNHYHWLLEAPEANLCDGMRWFQGTYAQRLSKRHGLVGHVFQGRYKALIIESDAPRYFKQVSEYIHLNPARGGLLNESSPVLADYKWSSYPYFIGHRRTCPKWLEFSRVAEGLGLQRDDAKNRRKYNQYLEGQAFQILKTLADENEEGKDNWKSIRRGWYLGSEDFKNELLDYLEKTLKGKRVTSLGGGESSKPTMRNRPKT
ncbi:MAG: hypothetical protein GKR87_09945 [Kiritimatiellae bacterium]|nr:hypothetical protein [Kiritimatiellia bacterium]